MMASRRTRIKGIANIPQRRNKTNENETITESDVKIEETQQNDTPNPNVEETSKQSNLNSDIVSNNLEKIIENHDNSPETGKNDEINEFPVEANRQNDKGSINIEETSKVGFESPNLNSDTYENKKAGKIDENRENPCKIENTAADDGITKQVGKNVETIEKKAHKPAPLRRKFIKSTVAIGAINRKSAKESGRKQAKSEEEPKNKIVILNEIITHENLTSTNTGDEASQESGPEIEIPQQTFEDTVKIVHNSPKKPPHIEKDSSQPLLNVITTNTDAEYPIPPPSPNKNRSRIKAIPRFSQRHTSFSASESEDESKRNNRHRNDSVCSTTSITAENVSMPDNILPQRPKEFNSLIQKKCRRTEQSRKLAEARRDFQMKFGNNKPDRQKLTMMDLIFYNPTTNLMSDAKRKRTTSVITENSDVQQEKQQAEEESVDDPSTKPNSDEEAETLAPQIKIDAQGEIVIDEQSLMIENKTNKKNWEALQNSQVIDGNFETGYGVYKRVKRSKDWTRQETLKFYKALNTLGTDFTLMSEFFPRRSRRELKMKFKKEERINKQFIDRALLQPCSFDYEEFKNEVDMEERELAEIERQKELDIQLKKEIGRKRNTAVFRAGHSNKAGTLENPTKPSKKPKKRRLDIMNVLSESDADVSEFDSDENDNKDEKILQNMQRPTRSGRVPKILDRYKSNDNDKKTENDQNKTNQNGSIMVVESTTAEGAAVFKVFMVTDQQKQIQKGARNLNSICTLRAESSEEDEDNGGDNREACKKIQMKEENATISAEDDAMINAEK